MAGSRLQDSERTGVVLYAAIGIRETHYGEGQPQMTANGWRAIAREIGDSYKVEGQGAQKDAPLTGDLPFALRSYASAILGYGSIGSQARGSEMVGEGRMGGEDVAPMGQREVGAGPREIKAEAVEAVSKEFREVSLG